MEDKKIIDKSDMLKKQWYISLNMLKEADEHKETQIRLQAKRDGVNELLEELGLRKKLEGGKSE